MDLMVLGPLRAVEDGRPLPLGGLKQRTVLALLIANRGRPVSTDALIDGVYGDVEHLHDDQQILRVPRYRSPFLIATDPAELVPLARERLTRTYTPDECATYGLDPCPTLDQVKAGG